MDALAQALPPDCAVGPMSFAMDGRRRLSVVLSIWNRGSRDLTPSGYLTLAHLGGPDLQSQSLTCTQPTIPPTGQGTLTTVLNILGLGNGLHRVRVLLDLGDDNASIEWIAWLEVSWKDGTPQIHLDQYPWPSGTGRSPAGGVCSNAPADGHRC